MRERPRTGSGLSTDRALSMRGTLLTIAEKANEEAFRTSRMLAHLDLRRARECQALAKRASHLLLALAQWNDPSFAQDKRLTDALEYQAVLQEASRLALAV